MKIILVGFMGSGKTAIGRALAKKLNMRFVEMDEEILKRTGFSNMKDLFDQKGEIHLREWEIRLALELSKHDDGVISTGGGVVMNKIILDYLKENNGVVIFLHAPFESLAERVLKDNTHRPLFKDEDEARDLYHFRLPLYKKYADIIIQTNNKSVEEIVEEMVLII